MSEEVATPPQISPEGQAQIDRLNNMAQNSASLFEGNTVERVEGGQPPVSTTQTTETTEQTNVLGNLPGEATTTAETTQTTETAETTTETTQTTEVGQEQGSTEAVEEEVSIESPLFGGKKVFQSADQSQEQKIESLETLTPILKENGIDDVSKLPEVLQTYKEQAGTIETLTKTVKGLEDVFAALPPDLYRAVDTFLNGGNWADAIPKTTLDFAADVNNLSNESLVEHFYPGEVSKEDWEEYKSEDGDPNVKRLVDNYIKLAKPQFQAKKEEVANYKQNLFNQQQQRQVVYQESLSKSIDVFKKDYPNVEEKYLKEISSIATPEGVVAMFFNENGSPKEDALTRLALAKDGKSLVDGYAAQLEKKLKNKVETQVNSELLNRAADEPTVQRGGGVNQVQVSPEVQKQLDRLKELSEREKSVFGS